MLEIQYLQEENIRWSIYFGRGLVVLFIVSWALEVVRIGFEEYTNFQFDVINPPESCTEKNESWSMYTPFTWVYTNLFIPPNKNDCLEYMRRTRYKIFLPRFPEAFSTTITHFVLTPFELFLDKFGNALRFFMDKFTLMERGFGILTLCFVLYVMTFFLKMVQPRLLLK